MDRPAATLRDKLAAYLGLRGQLRLARLRGRAEAPPPELVGLRRWLCEGWGQEALDEAETAGALPAEAVAALRAQLQEVATDAGQQAAEVQYRSALQDPDGRGALAPRLQRLLDTRQGRARAEAAGEVLAALSEPARRRVARLPPAAAGAPPELSSVLRGALDDAAGELVPWLCRECGHGSWHGLLCALRGPGLPGLASPARRVRTLAAGLESMGLSEELSRAVHVEPSRGQLWPHAEVLRMRPGRDLRVALGDVDHGLWSDLMAAEGVATALAGALHSPALPVELAHLPGVAPAFGGLYMQLHADPAYLAVTHGLRGREASALRRRAAAVWLVGVRLQLALEAPADPQASGGAPGQRIESLRDELGAALGCELPAALLYALWAASASAWPEGRAQPWLSGLALHAGLRERFDEDWYRNPRATPVLRGAAARGGGLSVQAFCDELGVGPPQARARLDELLG